MIWLSFWLFGSKLKEVGKEYYPYLANDQSSLIQTKEEPFMIRSDLIQYIKNTEKMVSPATVGTLFQRAEMLRKLPLKMQKFIVDKGSAKDPYISFVVEPYSFFLSYEIKNLEAANKQLLPDYELIPSSMFADTEPRYCAIVGVFNVHTSVFWGSRIELYLIAKNKNTGLKSWIICDYESNTISYDPGRGFLGPSTHCSIVTTAYSGELIIDIRSEDLTNQITLTADIKTGELTPLNQRLWVEGNLSVDYGGELEDVVSNPFGLIFDPKEMEQALKLPLENVHIEKNSFGSSMLEDKPFEACCFPFAQHFLTTSIPITSEIKNESDLEDAVMQFNEKMSSKM